MPIIPHYLLLFWRYEPIQLDKSIRGIKLGKQKVKLFADDVIVHLENLRESVLKLTQARKELSKLAEYKINTEKLIVFVHTKITSQKV